ncbi:hypothetical protein P171DRAFT_97981 [Karstenula rhodostoma CBS 690.94]|uniref:Zn(2)-C6 fungal-type domain-containing protein n=1 Tax=Karstenula rhodostoma CBS 690.94 TaxID=1392251 RepID=A0A9P4PBB7_9PLEO|nr:hypothetical protein P171DRAFT_97981 [Karstenula rhodostoma CBS 690.94]
MLGYISSTRKKSCKQCVKAKRRCDLGYPCCKRCFSKSLDCAYPNASVREAEVVIRQRTPDLAPLDHAGDNELVGVQPVGCEFDPATLHVSTSDSNSSSSPESWNDIVGDKENGENGWTRQAQYWKRSQEPAVSRQMMPKIWAPSWLSEEQVLFMVSKVRGFVPTLAFSGANVFIHTALYKSHQPTAFQDSISLSALYLAKTKQNAPILIRSIDEKINGLVASSNGWSLQEHLAAVQALIVYQIIRLFDGDLGQAGAAARHNRLLELWAAHLWKRSFAEPVAFSKAWDAWVFYESLRRTVLMSVFMRGCWSALIQDGLCDQVPVLARLPLSKGDGYWNIGEDEFERRVAGVDGRDQLIAYGDFSLSWKLGDDVGALSEFQRLLLAGCKGHMDPRLFLDGM